MARIIIVDDDDLIVEVATEALERAGHMVSAVDNGEDAVFAVEQSQPDLLILDYFLPGKTGMQILREVRDLPFAINMPIMMLTARAGRLHKLQADRDGADDYVVKPFDADDLVGRAEALLIGLGIASCANRKGN